MAGGAIGVSVAAFVRNVFHDDAAMQVGVIACVLFAAGIGAWIVHERTPKVTLRLPLCGPCDARLEEGLRWRNALLAGVGAFVLVGGWGIVADSNALLLTAVGIFVATLILAFAAKIPARMVQAAYAKEREVALKLDAAVAEDVVARAERARARREQEASEADDADAG